LKIRDAIRGAVGEALASLGWADAGTGVVLERPREAAHGDMSTPVAMTLARTLRRNPMQIAEELAAKIVLPAGVVDSVAVLPPGFVNFRFALGALRETVADAAARQERYGAAATLGGERVQVEYVSANPTGPLVLVSARAAAVGFALTNLLRFQGCDAEGEYYVNDFGKQIEALGESLRHRLRERLGLTGPTEEIGAYPGAYVAEIAQGVDEATARRWVEGRESGAALGRHAADRLLERIAADLASYGVRFDHFFRESSLHPEAADAIVHRVRDAGVTYERDGALYFRSTAYGDDKDRVLVKSNGEKTYFLSDVAYHATKLERGFTRAIGLMGPDHHGHVARMQAAVSVLGAGADWLEIMMVGWVRLMEDGAQISMSKRAGEFITMRELVDDVGADVAKYFFLMRRANTPLDFDLTLARKHSDENPVFYVQYAHARISSVIRFALEKGHGQASGEADLSRLDRDEERALMLHIAYFPLVAEGAAAAREPHRLTSYAQELATAFHQFYHECRIVTDDKALTAARLRLAEATMHVLRNALSLLGVSAPSSM
jgi:arginyl-tRNA synthetase